MELYQRVWAEQFLLTDEQKADVKAGKSVMWQDAQVRHNGATRFHVLLHIVDQERPVYENQWLVKVAGQTHILWDHEVKSRYLIALPAAATEQTAKPIQSEALKRFLENKKKNEVEEQQREPEQKSNMLDEFMQKGAVMQPEPPAQEAAAEIPEVEPPAQEAELP